MTTIRSLCVYCGSSTGRDPAHRAAAADVGRLLAANGVRLVYPMDERAMQFLNLCANKAFGLLFTWLLGQPVKDTLCGTKVLSRAHYDLIAANRAYFGDFDPFGDFDLLFGAAKLNLKIADVPIRYKERTDVLLALLEPGTTVAGVTTRSKCPSAPVEWCREKLRGGKARALVVNSGNANAFTGRNGRAQVDFTAKLAAKAAG